MVQIEEVRESFAARLREALAANEIPSWGAGARLAKMAGVTPKASSKWLNGESMPGGAKMLALAEALKVRPEWLEYGRGPCREEKHSSVAETGGTYRLPSGMIPLLPSAFFGASGAVVAAVAARSGANLDVDSTKDDESISSKNQLIVQVRHARAAMTVVDQDKAESFAQKLVGEVKYADHVLVLLDAILEAALLQAIDLEEIQAITTLVQKRKNEKTNITTPSRRE